ncbi:Ig-like domain-containing protein [Cardinium endosymbiont of Tipula unca]|uniref:Ig-like domain-containing protein n=1 Tax=Cardinium endosymbiont of Tipula unca TaxID=3066216 RepID=UPI0030D0419E
MLPFLFASCVTEQAPEGGPPDETPPKLVCSFPENGALNFKGNKIRLTFNKEIKVEGIYTNLLIMPKLDALKDKQPYSYTVNGKTLEIKFAIPLKEHTTYSMHFNNAVKDTHEGTKPTGAVLTFSTDSFIDAITAKGETKELLTNRPVGNVSVYLYSSERDPKEWQEKGGIPDYYTTTDKEGNFTMDHIRLGTYYIRATTGKSNKYEIDYEKDQYGFFKDPIHLNDFQSAILIPLISADVRDFTLLRSAPQKGIYEVVFNKPIIKYQLIPLEAIGAKGKPQIHSLLSDKSPRTIFIYNTFGLLEGEQLEVKLIAEDAYHTVLEKHLPIRFKEGKEDIEKTRLSHSVLTRPFPSILPSFTEVITFNKPIQETNQDLIYFELANEKKIPLKEEALAWNSDKTKLTIKKVFKQEEIAALSRAAQGEKDYDKTKKTVVLHMETGACIAFDKEKNKKIDIVYPFRNEEETGTISGNIDTAVEHFIIELLNDKDVIVDTVRNTKNYCFTMVPPGTYGIRILVLNEGEEVWSPGNIRKNIEPNPVIFYEKELAVVEKWDVTGIDFKF